MKTKYINVEYPAVLLAALVCVLSNMVPGGNVRAAAYVQCPGDNNGDAIVDRGGPQYERVRCMHLSAGDGFIKMGDGRLQYMFGFGNLTGIPEGESIAAGILAARFPAPAIVLDQGDEFYLTLTNVGMLMRPDLADPHTVHFHGFPNAGYIFDGLPDVSISINMGASLTYHYNIDRPGTYMYHCHVEATEHMQMGMLGNLYVRPAQNGTSYEYPPGSARSYTQFVYNDGDGSTGYDVEFPIQLGSFDPEFHDASMNVQPLPFADMKDTYAMLNGRGYPDTTNSGALVPPEENGSKPSQVESSLVEATVGQKILLRLSNLNITNYYTVGVSGGLAMKVVGNGASQMRGPDGKDLYYDTSSLTIGGGESADAIIDTAGIAPGTYFLYTTNLNYLSNNDEDYGGMMTEIRIAPAL